MSKRRTRCPHCGADFEQWDNPKPVVDILIEMDGNIVLIKRKQPPYGWAIPEGFWESTTSWVDYGESVESAVRREAREETSLEIENLRQFHVYSDPQRDPRQHTISTVFTATGLGIPRASDNAVDFGLFTEKILPPDLAFDHAQILKDFFTHRGDLR
ncbi:MAG: NUDIX hydrolase [bacterium]